MRIVVAGTGYVGLVTGVCFAQQGFSVTCVDVSQEKIDLLNSGKSPIYEPGMDELLAQNAPRLTFTTDAAGAYRTADVIFIGVGTPERPDGSANLDYVFDVVEQIAQSVEKDCVVVVKSTVPIGTNDRVEEYLRQNLAHPVQVDVASNPEFLAQGTAIHDTLYASRIVIGTQSQRPRRVLEQLYAPFDAPKLFTDRRSAEMIKYASNDFLALKISYINEIANLCETVGANVDDVAAGMGFDQRIGSRFLHAGIGYGGSCFPKDTKALDSFASIHGYPLKTVAATIAVNEGQKLRLLEKARAHYPSLKGLTVAVLGLTFKPGTDDLREAPSLVNVPRLLEEGARVQAWDPIGAENFRRRVQGDIAYCETPEQALEAADLCLILTEWPQIKQLAPQVFQQKMNQPIVLDGRNCFAIEALRASGARLRYESIGRPAVDTRREDQ